MAVAPDGSLVIVASDTRAGRFVAVRMPLGSRREDEASVLRGRGAVRSRVVARKRGVSFLAETRRGQLEAAGFAYGDMRRLPELRMREWL